MKSATKHSFKPIKTKRGWIKLNYCEFFPEKNVLRKVEEWRYGKWPLFIYDAEQIKDFPP
jgi:hypothetical protein